MLLKLFNENVVNKSFLNSLAKKYLIKYKYNEGIIDTVLLYNYAKINKPNEINVDCNGTVLEHTMDGWKVVCHPLPPFRSNKLITTNSYELFPVYEATIVNVYFSALKNRWCFGSKRCFDIAEGMWRGVSYAEVFERLRKDGLLVTDSLDKLKTYVYAFSTPNLHIFNKEYRCVLLGVGDELGYEFHDRLESSDGKTEEINRAALEMFYRTGEKHFGYILRGDNGSFILESSLISKINRMVYRPENVFDRELRRQYFKYNADIDYVIARCYLYYHDDAVKLFPEFVEAFNKCDKIRNGLISYSINRKKTGARGNVNYDFMYDRYCIEQEKNIGIFVKYKLKDAAFYRNELKYMH